MSRFWPQAEYAEDQRFGKSILTKHVLDRGFQTGGILGLAVGETLAILQYRRYRLATRAISTGTGTVAGAGTLAAAAKATAATSASNLKSMMLRTVVNASGVGALAGGSLLAVVMPFYMRGQSDIQWQDRSWRLLNSKSQVEVDDWTLVGEVVGVSTLMSTTINNLVGPRLAAAGGATSTAVNGLGGSKFMTGRYAPLVINMVGRASIGGTIGLLGYMVWRYGVHQGKRNGDDIHTLPGFAKANATSSIARQTGTQEKAMI